MVHHKTATYSGMNLKGELRESISLDDDDLSDVEDEVFIRDGKNGYKLAEDLNVKRPLMAPRRKHGKHESRLKPRPSCRALCKPCCYVLASLSILIGLIVLVVVLVSIYPVPLDKLRDWIISKAKTSQDGSKGNLPCTSFKVSSIWAVNLPALTTESPVRALDVDGDGIEDALFGFGTGDNYNLFAPDVFCPIFLGVSTPCEGGLIALNGKNGDVIWKRWLNDTIFGLHCNADINLDGVGDCLAVGVGGTIMVIDSKTGTDIWRLNPGKTNVFVANFIQDQNNDNITDVITSHSLLQDKTFGHVLILSGKTGQELKRVDTPKTFFMPQLLQQNSTSTLVLFGTGTPNAAGNLSAIDLNNNQSITLYEDKFKGILTQAVLVDITGDNIADVVSSMYNSTIVAIDGKTFKTIWNYTIPNAVTDMSPTPAYFNCDNITDFLVVYQKYDSIFNYNYTQTLIIDGFTGQPIYQPMSGGIVTQMSGLTLSMEGKGHDIYLFWTSECSNNEASQVDVSKKTGEYSKVHDECKKQFNSTTILKLNGLNEYHQPPGIAIYNSASNILFEYNNTKSPIKLLKDYLETHPINSGQAEIMSKIYNGDPGIGIIKYGKSNFRHKDKPNDIVKNFNVPQENDNSLPNNMPISEEQPIDYNIWMPNQEELDSEFSNYNLADDNIPYNQKQMLFDEVKVDDNNRDPRSKQQNQKGPISKKKNLADKIYGYHNLRLAKKRLLHDDESLPTDIIKDTYFKNEEARLRKNKLEQRDVNSHHSMDIEKILENQKREALLLNHSTTLWDIETENELGERDNQLSYFRRKRQANIAWNSVSKVTSVGAVLSAFNSSNSSIDVVFVKYWQPLGMSLQDLMAEECINDKKSEQECQDEQNRLRRSFADFERLAQLKLGQMTVYRMRIQCNCDSSYDKEIKEKCVRFLPKNAQGWSEYLGRNGDGVFTR
ncbi:unnamed protein product [Ceutorhynchus assimilis]|uniref:FAM234A/B beta-propeller domain-containing protein n=1 Tax=Ceutorhynchus assimilis TaxID=467358 RepID=A0A9N9MMD4_9CUCU|nr:unnamed protein product [Ceutorhynchus assimilis]